jgi:hypothetical protein
MTLTASAPNPLVQGPAHNADLVHALAEMKKAEPGYVKAVSYYEGENAEIFASTRVRRMLSRWGMNFNLDFAKTPVDAVAERLAVTSITTEDEATNERIQELMDANQFALQGNNVMRKACTFGDSYVMVWPEIDDDGSESGNVNILYQDPRLVRVFYDDENPLKVSYAIKRWQIGGGDFDEDNPYALAANPSKRPPVRVDLYYRDRIERFVTLKGSRGDKASEFQPYSGDEDDDGDQDWVGGPVVPNPYGIVPMFHFKTDADDYGTPEHKSFYSVQDLIHKIINNFAVVIDYQSFPQRVALMMEGTDSTEPAMLSESVFDIDLEPMGDTVPMAGTPNSQLSADPAAVWYLQGLQDIKQLDPADPAVFTGPIGNLITWGAQITSTPLNRFVAGGSPASGESLKITDAPFVKKVDNRKTSFGITWKAVFEAALMMSGVTNARVTVNWAPSSSSDNVTDWQVAKAKQDSGVPVSQTLAENGYRDEQITEWMDQGQADLPQRLASLVQVGEFLASSATAVAAGAVSAEQVQAILTSVMGDLSDDTKPAADGT